MTAVAVILLKTAVIAVIVVVQPDHGTAAPGPVGKTKFIARVGDGIIVIRDVPALVCDRCGEAYYSAEVSRRIDAVMADAHCGRLCCRPLAAGEVVLTG